MARGCTHIEQPSQPLLRRGILAVKGTHPEQVSLDESQDKRQSTPPSGSSCCYSLDTTLDTQGPWCSMLSSNSQTACQPGICDCSPSSGVQLCSLQKIIPAGLLDCLHALIRGGTGMAPHLSIQQLTTTQSMYLCPDCTCGSRGWG